MKIRRRVENDLVSNDGPASATVRKVEHDQAESPSEIASGGASEGRIQISNLARELQNLDPDRISDSDDDDSNARRIKVRRLTELYNSGELRPADSDSVAAAFVEALEDIIR